jgi:hypothetical protein
MALVRAPPGPSPPGPSPPCLQLGGVPYELAAAILLRLSPVERVLAERTCRGWRALLRTPALWAEMDVAATVRDLRAVLGRGSEVLHHLVRHAGAALRVVDDTRDELTWEALHAVFEHAGPSLEVLRLRAHVSADLGVAEGILLDARACARLRQLDVGRTPLWLRHDDAADVLDVLQCTLPPGCATQAVLRVDDLLAGDAAEMLPELGAAHAFGALLCACDWARVGVEVAVAQAHDAADADADAVLDAAAAARLRGFMAALTHARTRRVGLRIQPRLHAADAARVTHAAPPCVRFDDWNVVCAAADAPLLRQALRPGAVLGGSLTLAGPCCWRAADVQTAVDALRVCANVAADASGEEPLRMSLSLRLEPQAAQAALPHAAWSAEACEPLAAFLRSPRGAAVTSLDVCGASADALALLLPALPASLEALDLARCDGACAGVHDAVLRLLRARAGTLPATLRRLMLPPLDGAARARDFCDALAAAVPPPPPQRKLPLIIVGYAPRRAGDGAGMTRDEVECHLAMLSLAAHARMGARVDGGRLDSPERALADAAIRFFPAWREQRAEEADGADASVVRRVLSAALSALHAAAAADAAAGCRLAGVDTCSLARIVLASGDDAGEEDAFCTVAGACCDAEEGVASLLRSLAALLSHDAGGAVGALLHALLRSERAAALPQAVLRDVAAACGAALRRRPMDPDDAEPGDGYTALAWLLACTRAGIAPARDADAPPLVWLRRRTGGGGAREARAHERALVGAPLCALLRGAVDGGAATHAAHMRRTQQQQPREATAAVCEPHEARWRVEEALSLVGAACTLAPGALQAAGVREALLALCAESGSRAHFHDSLSRVGDLPCASLAARRAAEEYAACVHAALCADAATEGALQLGEALQAQCQEVARLRHAFHLLRDDGQEDEDG